MSKENALRFMLITEKDQALNNEMNVLISKSEQKDLSEEERDHVLKEIVLLAKKHGFDFTQEELKQLQKPAEQKLSDEELDAVTGGQGQITLTFRNRYHHVMTYKAFCDFAPDDQTFRTRYDQNQTDCPNYVWSGNDSPARVCMRCVNCRLGL